MNDHPFYVQARPHSAMRCWLILLIVVIMTLSTWLIPTLMNESLISIFGLFGVLTGTILSWILWASVMAGTQVWVDNEGICHYALGSRENFRFPLEAIKKIGFVDSGVLRGCGLDVELDKIEMLHRKGVTLTHMQSQAKGSGFGVILEFLGPDESAKLRTFWQAQQGLLHDQ